MDGAGENINLAAGVVDIIFAGDLVTGELQQAGKRIAHHRATAVPHVHGTGRIGGDVLDVDVDTLAHGRATIIFAGFVDCSQLGFPAGAHEAQVDEAGAGDLDRLHIWQGAQPGGDQFGKGARVGAGGLGEHHRGVGGKVAMRGIARRLHGDRRAVQPGRKFAGLHHVVEQAIQRGSDSGEDIHRVSGPVSIGGAAAGCCGRPAAGKISGSRYSGAGRW